MRLSEIAGAELTDETRGELDTLRAEYQDLEKRADACRMAGDASPDIPATVETSEGREYGQPDNPFQYWRDIRRQLYPQAVDRSDW